MTATNAVVVGPERVLIAESFREAVGLLRRPFTAEAVKFKVQATWPKGDQPTNGLVVCYIDQRLVTERLNLIVPHLWHDAYRPVGSGLMWCDLTVDGITRSDVGEGQGKALVSDALKRAAVKFGIGVSLYATPKMVIGVEGGQARVRKTARDGLTLELQPRGEVYVRNLYSTWLDTHAAKVYGDALDHGDVFDADGDPDEVQVIVEETAEAEAPPPTTTPPVADIGNLPELLAVKAAANIPDDEEGRHWVRGQVVAVLPLGAPIPDQITVGTLKALTDEQRATLIEAFRQIVARREQAGTS